MHRIYLYICEPSQPIETLNFHAAIFHYIIVTQAVVSGAVLIRRQITQCILNFCWYVGIMQYYPELINEYAVKMQLVKTGSHVSVKRTKVSITPQCERRISNKENHENKILTEAVEVRCDG
jgi:hypothetical protein